MLNAVTYGNNRFLVAGTGGMVLTSNDGQDWNAVPLLTAATLQGASFGNDTFVTVGDSGTIATSNDAQSWILQQSGSSAALHDVVYGNGLFVAVGDGGILLTSSDGGSWSSVNIGTTEVLWAVRFGAGVYVVVGAGGLLGYSRDGQTWTVQSGTFPTMRGLVYADGQFVGVRINANGKYKVERVPIGVRSVTVEGNGVPAAHASEKSSGLSVEVKSGTNTYDIEFWGPDGMCTSFYLGALNAISLMGKFLKKDITAYKKLYDAGKYSKAIRLFEQLAPALAATEWTTCWGHCFLPDGSLETSRRDTVKPSSW